MGRCWLPLRWIGDPWIFYLWVFSHPKILSKVSSSPPRQGFFFPRGEELQEIVMESLSPSLFHRLFIVTLSLSLPFAQCHSRTLSLPPSLPLALSLNLYLPPFCTESQLHTLSPSLLLALSLSLSLSLPLSQSHLSLFESLFSSNFLWITII